jgi:hypothetical protein
MLSSGLFYFTKHLTPKHQTANVSLRQQAAIFFLPFLPMYSQPTSASHGYAQYIRSLHGLLREWVGDAPPKSAIFFVLPQSFR